MLENNTFIQIIKMLDLKRSSLKVQVWGKKGHADRDAEPQPERQNPSESFFNL